jgi:peptidyl-prolyl cis-trans isomerase C
MIEEQIGRQLAQYAAFMPPDERKRQKEAMVQRLGTAEARLQLLDQLIAEDILYRKAREDKLAEDPDTRSLLADLERKLLAQRVVEKELAAQVKITPTDVQTYYEAHAKEYKEPEKAQVSHIQVKDETAAQATLKRLKGGEKFEAIAKELSLDAATKDKGGDVPDWAEKGAPIPGIGASDEAAAAIFTTEAGKVIEKPIKSDQGFHVIKIRAREPERQRPFEEVKTEVYRALRGQKSRDVQQQLLAELRERYNVIIHRAQFAPKETEPEAKGGTAPKAPPPKAAPKGTPVVPAK